MNTKKEMPSRSVMNGLEVETPPSHMADLSSLENTLIAVDIPFMKIRKVQKSQIEKVQDQTDLVPVEPADIMNTINSFSFQEL